jgi:hypothetical protein
LIRLVLRCHHCWLHPTQSKEHQWKTIIINLHSRPVRPRYQHQVHWVGPCVEAHCHLDTLVGSVLDASNLFRLQDIFAYANPATANTHATSRESKGSSKHQEHKFRQKNLHANL